VESGEGQEKNGDWGEMECKGEVKFVLFHFFLVYIYMQKNMAIKAIIELQARPGRREELIAFIDDIVSKHGGGGQGFLGSTRFEVLGNPDMLIEIADWESAEAREAHMKETAASGMYAPLGEMLAAPFKVTLVRQL
jgi:quinol monooxygenase YgiN